MFFSFAVNCHMGTRPAGIPSNVNIKCAGIKIQKIIKSTLIFYRTNELFILKIPHGLYTYTIVIARHITMIEIQARCPAIKLVPAEQPGHPEYFPFIMLRLIKYPGKF